LTSVVLLLLQFEPYGSDITDFFLMHYGSRKQQFQPSALFWSLAA